MRVRSLLRATGVAITVGATALVSALPSQAATSSTISSGHIAISAVVGRLPAGAGLSIVQTCPAGSRLDKRTTRRAGEAHTRGLRLASVELWPRGMVTRYRVVHRLAARRPTLVLTAAACRSALPEGSTRVHGRAVVDLRVWGPAPRRVTILSSAAVLVADDLESGEIFRTTMRAAGVNANHASVPHAVRAIQEEVDNGSDVTEIFAAGRIKRAVRVGTFASMQNHYRYTGHLNDVIEVP